MAEAKAEVLDKQVAYSGEGISVKALEESINTVRTRQNSKVADLKRLRERNVELQKALTDEVKRCSGKASVADRFQGQYPEQAAYCLSSPPER